MLSPICREKQAPMSNAWISLLPHRRCWRMVDGGAAAMMPQVFLDIRPDTRYKEPAPDRPLTSDQTP